MFIQWSTEESRKVFDGPVVRCPKCGKANNTKLDVQYSKSGIYWNLLAYTRSKINMVCANCGNSIETDLKKLTDKIPSNRLDDIKKPCGMNLGMKLIGIPVLLLIGIVLLSALLAIALPATVPSISNPHLAIKDGEAYIYGTPMFANNHYVGELSKNGEIQLPLEYKTNTGQEFITAVYSAETEDIARFWPLGQVEIGDIVCKTWVINSAQYNFNNRILLQWTQSDRDTTWEMCEEVGLQAYLDYVNSSAAVR